jgi:hypothetical protein
MRVLHLSKAALRSLHFGVLVVMAPTPGALTMRLHWPEIAAFAHARLNKFDKQSGMVSRVRVCQRSICQRNSWTLSATSFIP